MADEPVLDQWQAYVETNLTGPFVISQACIPYMKVEKDEEKSKLPDSNVGTAGPCILHVGSFRSLISDPNQEGYASTKGSSYFHIFILVQNRSLINAFSYSGLVGTYTEYGRFLAVVRHPSQHGFTRPNKGNSRERLCR